MISFCYQPIYLVTLKILSVLLENFTAGPEKSIVSVHMILGSLAPIKRPLSTKTLHHGKVPEISIIPDGSLLIGFLLTFRQAFVYFKFSFLKEVKSESFLKPLARRSPHEYASQNVPTPLLTGLMFCWESKGFNFSTFLRL
jgi:hypothetical protein